MMQFLHSGRSSYRIDQHLDEGQGRLDLEAQLASTWECPGRFCHVDVSASRSSVALPRLHRIHRLTVNEGNLHERFGFRSFSLEELADR
ncbi:MAG: hypothetical protein KME13_22455 [Myxacorys californica WJT36-NPBG1]|jgi:hypothetical protein|nr:hypothetical protein [Myxacorys californica WJT36-NPBG1]